MERKIYIIYFSCLIISSILYTSEIIGLSKAIIMLFLTSFIAYLIFIYKFSIRIKIDYISYYFLLFISYISLVFNKCREAIYYYSVFTIIIGICVIGRRILIKNTKIVMIKIMRLYNIISFIAGIFGLYCYYFNQQITIGGKKYGIMQDFFGSYAMTSIMQHPNGYGIFCAYSVMFTIVIIESCNFISKKFRIFMYLNIILQIHNIFYTGSRNSILIIGLFVFIYLMFFYNKGKYKFKVISFMGIVLILFIIILKTGVLDDTVIGIKLSQIDASSGRFTIWYAAFKIIKQHLFLGVGPQNISYYLSVSMNDFSNVYGSHSGYIDIIISQGIIVFILVYSIIFNVIIRGIKYTIKINDKMVNGIICIIISILFGNITESIVWGNVYIITVMFWIALIVLKQLTFNKKV